MGNKFEAVPLGAEIFPNDVSSPKHQSTWWTIVWDTTTMGIDKVQVFLAILVKRDIRLNHLEDKQGV